jgi:hypothetical protein
MKESKMAAIWIALFTVLKSARGVAAKELNNVYRRMLKQIYNNANFMLSVLLSVAVSYCHYTLEQRFKRKGSVTDPRPNRASNCKYICNNENVELCSSLMHAMRPARRQTLKHWTHKHWNNLFIIHFPVVSNLEHRDPFEVSVITHTVRRMVGLLWTSDQPVAEASTYTG